MDVVLAEKLLRHLRHLHVFRRRTEAGNIVISLNKRHIWKLYAAENDRHAMHHRMVTLQERIGGLIVVDQNQVGIPALYSINETIHAQKFLLLIIFLTIEIKSLEFDRGMSFFEILLYHFVEVLIAFVMRIVGMNDNDAMFFTSALRSTVGKQKRCHNNSQYLNNGYS